MVNRKWQTCTLFGAVHSSTAPMIRANVRDVSTCWSAPSTGSNRTSLTCMCPSRDAVILKCRCDRDDVLVQVTLDGRVVMFDGIRTTEYKDGQWMTVAGEWEGVFDTFTVVMVTDKTCVPRDAPVLANDIQTSVRTLQHVCSCISHDGRHIASGTPDVWKHIGSAPVCDGYYAVTMEDDELKIWSPDIVSTAWAAAPEHTVRGWTCPEHSQDVQRRVMGLTPEDELRYCNPSAVHYTFLPDSVTLTLLVSHARLTPTQCLLVGYGDACQDPMLGMFDTRVTRGSVELEHSDGTRRRVPVTECRDLHVCGLWTTSNGIYGVVYHHLQPVTTFYADGPGGLVRKGPVLRLGVSGGSHHMAIIVGNTAGGVRHPRVTAVVGETLRFDVEWWNGASMLEDPDNLLEGFLASPPRPVETRRIRIIKFCKCRGEDRCDDTVEMEATPEGVFQLLSSERQFPLLRTADSETMLRLMKGSVRANPPGNHWIDDIMK